MSTESPAAGIVASSAPVAESADAVVVEETAAPVEKEDNFSSRFAAVSRQERHNSQRAKALKDDADRYSKYADLESRVKADPKVLLEEYGITMEDLLASQYDVEAEPLTEMEEIQALKNQISEDKEAKAKEAQDALDAQATQQTEAESAAIAEHKENIVAFIEQNTDEYELTSILGQQDLIWDITDAQYEADGSLLSIEDASKLAENYLFEQAKLVLGAAKMQDFLNPKQETKTFMPTFETEDVAQRQSSAPKTLTTRFTSSNAGPSKTVSGRMTPEESKKSAAKWLEEELAKQ